MIIINPQEGSLDRYTYLNDPGMSVADEMLHKIFKHFSKYFGE